VDLELGSIFRDVSGHQTDSLLPYAALARLSYVLASYRLRMIPASCSMAAILFDALAPPEEQLPRKLQVEFRERIDDAGRPVVQLWCHNQPLGDPIRDNTVIPDGYRYHDVFHLAEIAILGWSPAWRKLLNCKRRSLPFVHETQDGGRATVADEAFASIVFEHAFRSGFPEKPLQVGFHLLETVSLLLSRFEVAAHPRSSLVRCVEEGIQAWRSLILRRGGVVIARLDTQTLSVEKPLAKQTAECHRN